MLPWANKIAAQPATHTAKNRFWQGIFWPLQVCHRTHTHMFLPSMYKINSTLILLASFVKLRFLQLKCLSPSVLLYVYLVWTCILISHYDTWWSWERIISTFLLSKTKPSLETYLLCRKWLMAGGQDRLVTNVWYGRLAAALPREEKAHRSAQWAHGAASTVSLALHLILKADPFFWKLSTFH